MDYPVNLLTREIQQKECCRGVAQTGSAPRSGRGGRRFKSSRPDQSFLHDLMGRAQNFPKLVQDSLPVYHNIRNLTG